MALNSTVYKVDISLSDLNRQYYDSLNLVVAQHPSETLARMMARIFAFCFCAEEMLEFTKGLSEPDTPDIWSRSLDNQIQSWIEVGEPNADALKKATRRANKVWVFTFNSKSDVWWSQEAASLNALPINVIQLKHSELEDLVRLVQRKMTLTVTLSENSAYVTTDDGNCELSWQVLQSID